MGSELQSSAREAHAIPERLEFLLCRPFPAALAPHICRPAVLINLLRQERPAGRRSACMRIHAALRFFLVETRIRALLHHLEPPLESAYPRKNAAAGLGLTAV